MLNNILKSTFDFVFSILGIVVLSPLILIISLAIKISSPGPVFFQQDRVGINSSCFKIIKFRTMFQSQENTASLLTVGTRDPRVTRVGYWLRKFKLDEIPQLFNVLAGQMSFVGPRPEVKKYTDLYNPAQKDVLNVRPGITDLASINSYNESELLGKVNDPEKYYIQQLMPKKIEINLQYIQRANILWDILIIIVTIFPFKFLVTYITLKFTNRILPLF